MQQTHKELFLLKGVTLVCEATEEYYISWYFYSVSDWKIIIFLVVLVRHITFICVSKRIKCFLVSVCQKQPTWDGTCGKKLVIIQEKVNHRHQIDHIRAKYCFYLTRWGIDGRNMQARNVYLTWSIIKKHLRHGFLHGWSLLLEQPR